eukprot:CAMPEP_0118937558 /NCGR_PEP_ID=MMETSP1169-20130426/23146_1 /TAXON_ID=36882 /ORGANISM="Pyramimonas obovata, Strain CCMP722" /LENGTH=235 /DNA_ID=CAMNT_0006881231 /DNA_START=150 /DNA_END=854 /DNA_ORIENTATION=+
MSVAHTISTSTRISRVNGVTWRSPHAVRGSKVHLSRRSLTRRVIVRATYTKDENKDVPKDKRAAVAIDLFERAATPIGQVERAQAALAAADAMTRNQDKTKRYKVVQKVSMTDAPPTPSSLKPSGLRKKKKIAPVKDDEIDKQLRYTDDALGTALGDDTSAFSGSSGYSQSSSPSPTSNTAPTSTPGPDFWSWAPPPQMKKATKTATQLAAPTALMERAGSASLPPLQSAVEVLS